MHPELSRPCRRRSPRTSTRTLWLSSQTPGSYRSPRLRPEQRLDGLAGAGCGAVTGVDQAVPQGLVGLREVSGCAKTTFSASCGERARVKKTSVVSGAAAAALGVLAGTTASTVTLLSRSRAPGSPILVVR